MPNYTYQCPACGQTKDLVVPIAERDTTDQARCYCQSDAQLGHMAYVLMQRQVSAPRGTKVVGGTPKFYK